jgi:hypothetical protein
MSRSPSPIIIPQQFRCEKRKGALSLHLKRSVFPARLRITAAIVQMIPGSFINSDNYATRDEDSDQIGVIVQASIQEAES